MSLFDKIIDAVTPPESHETRMKARAEARAAAAPGDWLNAVIDHHEQIEAAFAEVRDATSAGTRLAALKALAVLLTGHSNAEEAVLYPAMVDSGHKAHSGLAYEEQAMAKVQLALLEKIEPMSEDFLNKLGHLQGAVTHHMYQEESSWFLKLKEEVPAAEQAKLAGRYREEIDRYAGRELA
ncbi:MAG: hemerythrin domain-containing protein [Sphingobium sp.]|nr:hemerythrin domain-containing protein [Sphingobium sp.]